MLEMDIIKSNDKAVSIPLLSQVSTETRPWADQFNIFPTSQDNCE
jgi:hypothetical protein